MEPDANPSGGALTVDQAAATLGGLLGSGDANPEKPEAKPERQAAQEPQPEPAGEQDEGDDSGEVDAPDDDQESAEDDGAGDDAEEPRFTVTIGGKEQEVTLDELRAGYQRETDYRRKTMGLAEERKAAQAQREALAEQERQLAARLTELNELYPEQQAPDWAQLADDDPGEYIRQKAKWDAEAQKRERLTAERDKVLGDLQQRQQMATEAFLSEQRDLLLKALPDWRKPEVAAKEKEALEKYATSKAGFSSAELNGLSDHRALIILRKAMLYDRLQEGKANVTKKVAEAAPLLKPGNKRSRSEVDGERQAARRKQLAQTGSRDVAAAMIAERFKIK